MGVLDTDSVATDTVLATTDTPVLDTTATTARGLLMLSPLPLLRLIPTTDTTATVLTDTVLAPTDTDTVLDTVATTVATTARGPLPPSPLPPLMPRLIPTTDTTATDTVLVLDTVPTDTVLATTATAMVCTDTTDKCP